MSITYIQKALLKLGFDPGPIDGISGRLTIQAIKVFQATCGLTPDGLVGPQTSAILFDHSAPMKSKPFAIPVTIPWLETAYDLIGTQEHPGAGSNEAIFGWAESLDIIAYNDDEIPWCGLFVAHCIGCQLPEEPLPTKPLGARKWHKFGHEVSPRLGAVMVFWRGSPNGWKGHVGFYWAQDNDAYHIIGGNQANSVSVTRIAKTRLLSARWPQGGLSSDNITRLAANNGRLLSSNEA